MIIFTAQIDYKGSVYEAMLIVSLAELPGYALIYFIAVKWGRSKGLVLFSAASAFFLIMLFLKPFLSLWLLVPLMFMGRLSVSSLFDLVALYTFEAFPTTMRSTGAGVCSACARVGGILTPMVAIYLHEKSEAYSILTYSLLAMLATFACMKLPFDTLGRPLQDTVRG